MNFKIAFVGASLMAFAGIFAAGCGGDDCTKAADTLQAKLDSCSVKLATTSTSTTAATTCTAAQGTLALCSAACFDAASCDFLKCGIGGDMTACAAVKAADSKAFTDCSSKCTAAK